MPKNTEKPKFREDENIVENKNLSIGEALIPVIALVAMLAYNAWHSILANRFVSFPPCSPPRLRNPRQGRRED